ncbi:MAG TPA: vWA domain-containing protein [Ignavibacteriaceae bacterium]|nr:vWA domain-containing protein [Ignavibacteriaceae bacterium]
MKQPIIFLLSFFVSLVLFGDKAISSENPNANTVQLAILLDTSNSMDGLIEQTKTQLWKIVNEIARSKRESIAISLYVALYEYGNDGLSPTEGFVRLVTPLTNDLDKISEELFKLKTNGGSEYCGTVISEAIKDLKWTKSINDYKVIFIAGNEPFNQGNVDYKEACKSAISKGIIVNTIYCGSYDEGLSSFWKDGADLADGKYINIDSDQQIVHIETPFDDELVQLGQKINETYIAFGYEGNELKQRQKEQDDNASSLAPSVMVERSVTKGSGQYNNSTWDLVDAKKDGSLDLTKIPKDQLPKEMQKMSIEEQKKYIDNKAKEREKYQSRINELDKQRRDYIAKKISENKEENTLDAAMLKMIREQASNKNYKFQ